VAAGAPCGRGPPPPAAAGHRRRPDGIDLRWLQLGVDAVASDPQLPFFVQWQCPDDEHPSAGGSPVRLARIEIAGDRGRVNTYLGLSAPQPLDGIELNWRPPGDAGTGLVAAEFVAPTGRVVID
jgi:hypothetical protein